MKKKLVFVLSLICIMCIAVAGVNVAVFAGTNVNDVAVGGLMSPDGTGLNETYFTIQDDNAEKSAYSYVKGGNTYMQFKGAGSGGAFAINKTISPEKISDDFVATVKFDLMEYMASSQIWFSPFSDTLSAASYIGAGWKQYLTKLVITSNSMLFNIAANASNSLTKAFDAEGNEIVISNNVVTLPADKAPWSADLWNEMAEDGKNHITLWFEAAAKDKAVTLYYGYDANDGTAPTKTKVITLKNAFELYDTFSGYTFGTFNGWDAYVAFDNYSLTIDYKDGGEMKTQVVGTCNFEDSSKYGTDISKVDFFFGAGAVSPYAGITRIIAENPGQDARIVTNGQLVITEGVDDVFDMELEMKISQLAETNKVGVAFGLKNSLSRPSEGCSFIYLRIQDNVVYLGAQNDGVMISEEIVSVILGEESDYIKFKMKGKADGSIVVTINDAETPAATFQGLKIAGRVAFTQLGVGNLTYELKSEMKLNGYTFDAGVGQTIYQNFNSGYIDPSKYTLISNNAKNVAAGAESNGVYAEDGKLFFDGAGTHSRIVFNKTYSDFVMQVDYTSLKIEDRVEKTISRYSPMSLIFGLPETSISWSNGYIVGVTDGHDGTFYGSPTLISKMGKWDGTKAISDVRDPLETDAVDDIFKFQVTNNEVTELVDKVESPKDGYFSLYNRTTRFKLVVVNNKVGAWMAQVNADGTVGEYVLLFEDEVSRSFGYVGIASDDPASFKIDNLCITPITDQALSLGNDCKASDVEYIDVIPADIEDDVPPMPLAAPTATVSDKTVSWTAVPNAAKYIVSIQKGTNLPTTVETTSTSYTLTMTEVGEYKITVQAIPEEGSMQYLESAKSSMVTIKITNSGGSSGGEGTESGCGGCGGNVTALSSIFLIGALAVCLIMMIKRKVR